MYPTVNATAWDLCRICNLAGWGFEIDHLTFDECMEISIRACHMVQDRFGSWDELMESYFLGLKCWSGENDNSYNIKRRTDLYDQMRQMQILYEVPWNSEISLDDNLKIPKSVWDTSRNRHRKRFWQNVICIIMIIIMICIIRFA